MLPQRVAIHKSGVDVTGFAINADPITRAVDTGLVHVGYLYLRASSAAAACIVGRDAIS